MKNKQFREGQNGALMDLYENAIEEFCKLISSIPEEIFNKNFSNDKIFNSIGSITLHVIDSGYAYANYYRKRFNEKCYDVEIKHSTPQAAIESLNKMFTFTIESLESKWSMTDAEMMNTLIKTAWTIYDLEALWEHAIVHVMRHGRQIERILESKT